MYIYMYIYIHVYIFYMPYMIYHIGIKTLSIYNTPTNDCCL